MTMPDAVLWDMDGTLVDSEPLWIATETELVAEFGGEWTLEDGYGLVGKDMSTSTRVLQAHGVDLDAETISGRMQEGVIARMATDLQWQPGALDLVLELYMLGVPMALVTSSPRAVAKAVLATLPDPVFDVVVALEDVTAPKPNPAPYLLAADRLGVNIGACVALEDSPSGLAAAASSGAVTIGVPHAVPLDEARLDANWQGLRGKTVEGLADVFSTSRVLR